MADSALPGRLRAPADSVLARFHPAYLAFLADLGRLPWPRAREPILQQNPFLWHLIQVMGPAVSGRRGPGRA